MQSSWEVTYSWFFVLKWGERIGARLAVGNFSCPIEVFSEDGNRSATVDAMVDTGATFTCLPGSVLHDLGIVPSRKLRFELADGNIIEDDIGETRVKVEGIETITIVVFASDTAPALLGAYTLEGTLLAVDPVNQRLVPTVALRYARSPVVLGERAPAQSQWQGSHNFLRGPSWIT